MCPIERVLRECLCQSNILHPQKIKRQHKVTSAFDVLVKNLEKTSRNIAGEMIQNIYLNVMIFVNLGT